MDLSFITRVMLPQNGTGTLQGGSTWHQTKVLSAADLLMGRNTAGKETQRGQGRRKRSQKSRRALLVRVPAGHEELPVFCPSPEPGESHGKSCTYRAGGKHTGITAADKRIGLFPTSPTILHQGQEKSFHVQTQGRSQAVAHPPQMVQIAHSCSWWQDTGKAES